MKKYILIGILISLNAYASQLPTKTDVIGKMKLVNDYWISQNPNPGNNQWARAAYFTGNMDFYTVYPKDSYLQYANLWANNNSWGLNGGTATRNADNQICGQVYIDLFNRDAIKDSSKIKAIKTSIDAMVSSTKSDDWWWVDALYMGMPVFARLGVLENDTAYFNKMFELYTNTKVTRGLFNPTSGLWYRDESYDPPYTTPNGMDSYWARGNGWAIAALTRVLQLLPENNVLRAGLIETFQKMAAALKDRQRTDGFWNPSLDDPNDFGGPETSGTGFFTYGLAWGINNHLLDSATYYPVVAKAWNGLVSIAVQPNGFLGYVQGVGAGPANAPAGSTQDFGVGAFLLAGTEVVKMAEGLMPVPSNFGMTSIKAMDKTHIQISFSKKIDLTAALNASNYSINNNVSVLSVIAGKNDSSTILQVGELNYGSYQVQIKNISSADGSPVEAGESGSFVYTGNIVISASDYEAGTSNTADKTMDFDFSTRWSSLGKGQWILYDLGEAKKVSSVDVAFYNGNVRKSYFKIELSADGTNFTEVFNGESSGKTTDLENYDYPDQDARYLKITGNGNSQSLWNSITEARINFEDNPTAIPKLSTINPILTLYPNPLSDNQLTIILNSDNSGINNLTIKDMCGKTVYLNTVQSIGGRMKITDLKLIPGCYTLLVEQNSVQNAGLLLVK
ncbi:MAG: glycoside hydrolase family 88 protein [Paludibacter sp.]